MPKRRLLFLITSLATLTLAVALLALGIIRKWQLDTSSQELAIALTQSALTSNPAILRENGSTEWQQSMSEQAVLNYLGLVRQTLGELRTMQRISGSSQVPLFILSQTVPIASYTLALEFANTEADASIELRMQDGNWQITKFIVNSDLLLE